jgi:isopentenyl-diphosphate delta-isomerase
MFLTGANNIPAMSMIPVVVTGWSAEWLKTRGFDIAKYAVRGR